MAQKMFKQPYAALSEAQKAQLPKGPYFPNAEFFMEKALEYKGYLGFDPATKSFIDGTITLDEIKEFFPQIGDPNAHAPIDGTRPWWKTSMLAPAGGNAIQLAAWAYGRAARPVVPAPVRMAA